MPSVDRGHAGRAPRRVGLPLAFARQPVLPSACLDDVGTLERVSFHGSIWTLEEMIVEGDKVAARFIMRGTHHGLEVRE